MLDGVTDSACVSPARLQVRWESQRRTSILPHLRPVLLTVGSAVAGETHFRKRRPGDRGWAETGRAGGRRVPGPRGPLEQTPGLSGRGRATHLHGGLSRQDAVLFGKLVGRRLTAPVEKKNNHK